MAKKNGGGNGGAKRGPAKGSKRIDFKDVSLAFVTDGLNGVRALEEELGRPIAENVLWTAIEAMSNQDTKKLRDFTVTRYGEPGEPGQRGRAAPKVGDKKQYKVQEINDTMFLRLPVGPLNVRKGGLVTVEYAPGRITITT
jgi:hypothetical protein